MKKKEFSIQQMRYENTQYNEHIIEAFKGTLVIAYCQLRDEEEKRPIHIKMMAYNHTIIPILERIYEKTKSPNSKSVVGKT
jgi:hypothetical protein